MNDFYDDDEDYLPETKRFSGKSYKLICTIEGEADDQDYLEQMNLMASQGWTHQRIFRSQNKAVVYGIKPKRFLVDS